MALQLHANTTLSNAPHTPPAGTVNQVALFSSVSPGCRTVRCRHQAGKMASHEIITFLGGQEGCGPFPYSMYACEGLWHAPYMGQLSVLDADPL